jgi:hypothetical protein
VVEDDDADDAAAEEDDDAAAPAPALDSEDEGYKNAQAAIKR